MGVCSVLTREQDGLLSERPKLTRSLEIPNFLFAFPIPHQDGGGWNGTENILVSKVRF